jgi:hypothetical protein
MDINELMLFLSSIPSMYDFSQTANPEGILIMNNVSCVSFFFSTEEISKLTLFKILKLTFEYPKVNLDEVPVEEGDLSTLELK